MLTKVCCICKKQKPINEFHTQTHLGGRRVRSFCIECERERSKLRRPQKLEESKRYNAKYKDVVSARRSLKRMDPKNRCKNILADCKSIDRKTGNENDMDVGFIKQLTERGCSYCGISPNEVLMTLDRIDNSLPHNKSNVIQACIRCNIIRRDMPYYAWMAIVPAVKSAMLSGLFGDWVPGNGKRSSGHHSVKTKEELQETVRRHKEMLSHETLPFQQLSLTLPL
jgi:hypothetical protein